MGSSSRRPGQADGSKARASAMRAALALALLASASAGAAGCEGIGGGVCIAERFVNLGCKSERAQGHLARIQIARPGEGRAEAQTPEPLLAQGRSLDWAGPEAAWTHVRALGEFAILFSINSGELALLDERPTPADLASPVTLPRRLLGLGNAWTDFDAVWDSPQHVRVVAVDALSGRLVVARVGVQGQTPAEILLDRTDAQFKDLERVRLIPLPTLAPASTPISLELWSPFSDRAVALELPTRPAGSTTAATPTLRPLVVPPGTVERRYAWTDDSLVRASLANLATLIPATRPTAPIAKPSSPTNSALVELAARRNLVLERVSADPSQPDHELLRLPASDVDVGFTWSEIDLRVAGGRAHLLRYDTVTGRIRSSEIDPQSGHERDRHESFVEGQLTSVSLMPAAGSTQWTLYGLNPLGAQTLDPESLDRLAGRVREEALAHAPGFQFTLMQGGELVYREAGGYMQLAQGSGDGGGVPMDPRVRMNVASVSKVVTAVSVLREVEAGQLKLDQAISIGLGQPVGAELRDAIDDLTLRELLTHRSVLKKSECPRDERGDPNCEPVLDSGREAWRCNDEGGHACCPRVYQNANYQLARKQLEYLWSADSSSQLASESHSRWMDSVGLGETSCTPDLSAPLRYYGRAGAGAGDWRRYTPQHSGGCDSSGWHFSALELTRFMRALRMRWLLSEEMREELFSCGETGWLAWDTPWPSVDVHVKSGSLGTEEYQLSSVVVAMPRQIDAVLLLNGRESGHPQHYASSLLHRAWYGTTLP